VIRNDFCFIVLALALADVLWILLPTGAIGAQVYWMLQFVKGFRRHHF
jgi:nitrate reductase NapE component